MWMHLLLCANLLIYLLIYLLTDCLPPYALVNVLTFSLTCVRTYILADDR